MAGLNCYQSSDEILTATDNVWHTLATIKAAANQRVNIESWSVKCRGTVNSDKPIETRLIRVSTDGSGSSTKAASKQNTAFPETPTTEFRHAHSGEPTVSGDHLDSKPVHPQTAFEQISPASRMKQLGGGERAAVQYRNNAGTANIPISADISWEE